MLHPYKRTTSNNVKGQRLFQIYATLIRLLFFAATVAVEHVVIAKRLSRDTHA